MNETETEGGAGRPVVHSHQPTRCRGGFTHPRHQSEDGPRMREEGDRVESDAPGLPGAVRARCLHPSGFSAA